MAIYPSYPQQENVTHYGAAGIDDEDKEWQRGGVVGRYLHAYTPEPPQRLKVFSVVCIITNRMIGVCP